MNILNESSNSLAKHFPNKVLKIRCVDSTTFDAILRYGLDHGVRDIWIVSGDYIRGQINNRKVLMTDRPLTHDEVATLLRDPVKSLDRVYQGYSANPSYIYVDPINLNNKRSFRLSVTKFSNVNTEGFNCAIRPMPKVPPTVLEIGLSPDTLSHIRKCKQGLILLIGGTGHGKTSTVAAILRYVLERDSHFRVVEFSRPVENIWDGVKIHPSNHIIAHNVSEDGISGDINSYEEAIKTAMRQAPDWLVVGEMTEAESFKAAIEFSNTGHIVSSTMHANSVASAYSRVYMKFPASEREALTDNLISETEVMIAQELVECLRGGLIAVRETLIHTHSVKEQLKAAVDGPLSEFKRVVNQCISQQGTSFYQEAYNLYQLSLISIETLQQVERTHGKYTSGKS